MFRIPFATLRLKQPQKALLRESRGILRIRYMMLMALHGTDNADHPTVPGDLADLLRRPLPDTGMLHHSGLVRYAHATLKLLLPAKRRNNLQGLVHLGLSKRPFRLAPHK